MIDALARLWGSRKTWVGVGTCIAALSPQIIPFLTLWYNWDDRHVKLATTGANMLSGCFTVLGGTVIHAIGQEDKGAKMMAPTPEAQRAPPDA